MTPYSSILGTLSGGNCGVTSSRSRSFDVSSLIGLSPNDNSRQQRSGSCSPPTPAPTAAVPGSRMAPLSSHPSPNVSVGPPAPPPPTANTAPPVAPSGLYPFLLHPGLYQHLITGKPWHFHVFIKSLCSLTTRPTASTILVETCFISF